MNTKFPFDPNKPTPSGEMFRANPDLRDWAYDLTKGLALVNPPELASTTKLYAGYPNAQRPPFVLKGGHIAAMTFWHGALMNN